MISPNRAKTQIGAMTRWLIRVRIWLGARFRISEVQASILWAALVGLAGAWVGIGFREATEWLHALFTGSHEGFVASFAAMP